MKCPNCNETLLMTERSKIEIDYCPSCRGVWLDKGELDKLLDYVEHSSSGQTQVRSTYPLNHADQQWGKTNPYPYNRHRKKKSFLSDFFDFD